MTVVRRKGRGVDGHARGIGYGLVGFATPRFNGSRQPVSSGAARHCQPVLKPGRPFLLVIEFLPLRAAQAQMRREYGDGRPEALGCVPIRMGKRSTEKQPPRLWPCEKALLAGFEPRNASGRTPRASRCAPEAETGVTAGETARIVPRTALVTEYIGRLSESGCAVCLPGLGGCGRASRTSAVGGTREDARKRRGVEGHARSRRDGTGRDNPAQGILVREQQQAERPGTLIAPTQAGFESGRRFLAESP